MRRIRASAAGDRRGNGAILKKQNNANKAGKGVEEALAAFMRVLRWDFDQHVKAGPSIYKGQIQVVDFVIRNLKDFLPGLIVESRWQSKHGTVDQKFPYLQKSLETCAMPSIVIVSGGGCRSGALAWLKEQCDDHSARCLQPG